MTTQNLYMAFYKGRTPVEVCAETSYAAQLRAAELFRARKSYDVRVVLAAKDGEVVTHVAAD